MTNLGDVFRGFRISSSGLSAERTRINVIASNIANAHTTRMPGSDEPAPYQRQVVHFEPVLERHAGEATPMGVRVVEVGHDSATPFGWIPQTLERSAAGFPARQQGNPNALLLKRLRLVTHSVHSLPPCRPEGYPATS